MRFMCISNHVININQIRRDINDLQYSYEFCFIEKRVGIYYAIEVCVCVYFFYCCPI